MFLSVWTRACRLFCVIVCPHPCRFCCPQCCRLGPWEPLQVGSSHAQASVYSRLIGTFPAPVSSRHPGCFWEVGCRSQIQVLGVHVSPLDPPQDSVLAPMECQLLHSAGGDCLLWNTSSILKISEELSSYVEALKEGVAHRCVVLLLGVPICCPCVSIGYVSLDHSSEDVSELLTCCFEAGFAALSARPSLSVFGVPVIVFMERSYFVVSTQLRALSPFHPLAGMTIVFSGSRALAALVSRATIVLSLSFYCCFIHCLS